MAAAPGRMRRASTSTIGSTGTRTSHLRLWNKQDADEDGRSIGPSTARRAGTSVGMGTSLEATTVASEAGAFDQEEARVIWESVEEREKNSEVIFRFVNAQEGSRKCHAAYETFSPFDPDPTTLASMTLFRRYISVTDFETLLEALNILVAKYRAYSRRWLVFLSICSFLSLVLAIFLHYALGITAQLTVLIIYSFAQSYLRRSCPNVLNNFLVEDINEKLLESRHVYLKTQQETDGCAAWLELDVCQKQRTLDLAALREQDKDQFRKEESDNPMQPPRVPDGTESEGYLAGVSDMEGGFSDLGPGDAVVRPARRSTSSWKPSTANRIERWRIQQEDPNGDISSSGAVAIDAVTGGVDSDAVLGTVTEPSAAPPVAAPAGAGSSGVVVGSLLPRESVTITISSPRQPSQDGPPLSISEDPRSEGDVGDSGETPRSSSTRSRSLSFSDSASPTTKPKRGRSVSLFRRKSLAKKP